MGKVYSRTFSFNENINNNKQNYSASYKDNDRSIIACIGANKQDNPIRSYNKTRLTSNIIVSVLSKISPLTLKHISPKELEEKIKSLLIRELNKRLLPYIYRKFNSTEEVKINKNIEKLTVPNFTGVIHIRNKIIIVSLGNMINLQIKDNDIKYVNNINDEQVEINNIYDSIDICVLEEKQCDSLIILSRNALTCLDDSSEKLFSNYIKPILNNSSYGNISKVIRNLPSDKEVSFAYLNTK